MTAISSLSASKAYRYLGVESESRPKDYRKWQAASRHSILKKQQNYISAAPLKPRQCLKILRDHVLPRLTHLLVPVKLTKDLLLCLVVLVRRAVNKWLRLPHCSPWAYYACAYCARLVIKSFMEHMMKLRERHLRAASLQCTGGGLASAWFYLEKSQS